MPIQIQKMRSIMYITNLQTAIEFYESLGLSRQWQSETTQATAVGIGAHAIQLMLIKTPDDQQTEIHPQSISVTLESGIDELHARCLNAQPTNTGPIGDREYSMRDFSVMDHDGHMLIFGQSLCPKDNT